MAQFAKLHPQQQEHEVYLGDLIVSDFMILPSYPTLRQGKSRVSQSGSTVFPNFVSREDYENRSPHPEFLEKPYIEYYENVAVAA